MSVEQQVKTLAFAYVLTFFIIMITAYAVLSSLVVIRNKCADYREPFGLAAFSFTVGAITNMLMPACCIVTALLADEKPVKLALLVVNTATTLLALGINIFAPYLEAEILSQAGEQIMSGAVSAYFNSMIFPLVGAGYLSLLIKEAQVYLEEKRAVKDCKENVAQI